MAGWSWESGGSSSGGSSSGWSWDKTPTSPVQIAPVGRTAGRIGPATGGGGGLGIFGNLVSDVVDTARGFPQGIKTAGGALWHDIKTPGPALGGSSDSQFFEKVLKPIGEQYKYQYGPLAHGDFGEFGKRLEEHPLGPILDVATLASLGAAGTVRAGRGLAAVGMEGGVARPFVRYARSVDAPRMIEVRIGDREGTFTVPIEVRKAKTPYGRALNNVVDFLGTKYQDAPLIGNVRRDIKLGGRDVQLERTRHLALIRPFERTIRPLDTTERFAYHLAFEGRSPAEAFRATMELHDAQPSVQLRAYMERLAGKKWSKIEKDLATGVDPMADSPIAAAVANPSERFVHAVEAGKSLEEAGGSALIRAGVLTPEIREARKWLARRLESGARYDEGRTPSAAALHHAKTVERLEKEHDRVLARAEKETAKAQERVSKLEAEQRQLEIKGGIETGESRTRLKELDLMYEKAIAGIERELTGGVWDPAEHGRRNMETRISRGKMRRPTVKQEVRGMAEEQFYKMLEDPRLAEVKAAMEERQMLRDTLNDPERMFGEGTTLTRGEKARLTTISNRLDRMRASEANPLSRSPVAARADKIGSALSVARDRLERFNMEEREPGFRGGKDIETLRAERQAEVAGRRESDVAGQFGEPARFPHEGLKERENILSAVEGRRVPTREPGAPASTKLNKGQRLLASKLITDPMMLSRDYLRSMGHRLAVDYHDWLKDRAIPLKNPTPDDGMVYFRMGDAPLQRSVVESGPGMRDLYVKNVEKGERALAREQMERLPKQLVWKEGEHWPEDLERGTVEKLTEQGVWQVPERYAKQFLRETHQSGDVMRRFFDQPLDIWRAIVLSYRPAWLVNNIVGQHLLYALHHFGPQGARAYIDALRLEKGDEPALKLGKWTMAHKRRSKWGKVIDEVFPGYSFGGFFRSQEFGQGGMYLGTSRAGRAMERSLERSPAHPTRLAASAVAGAARTVRSFGDAMNYLNYHVADDLPRRAAFIREARRSKAIKSIKKQAKELEGVNLTLEQALRRADNATLNKLVDEVNRALGNFSQLGPLERHYIRRAIPFYSWFKTISLITGGLAIDHPGRVLMLQKMAEIGEDPAGPMPSYLSGAIPLGAASGNEQTLLSTMAVNPFETPIALGEAGASLFPFMRTDENGNPDVNQRGTGSIFGLLNPIVGAGMAAAGRDIFYGSDYRGPGAGRGPAAQFFGYFGGLPQFRLAEQLGLYGDYQSTLYNPNYRVAGIPPSIWAYLGLPVRRVKLDEARTRAQSGQ